MKDETRTRIPYGTQKNNYMRKRETLLWKMKPKQGFHMVHTNNNNNNNNNNISL